MSKLPHKTMAYHKVIIGEVVEKWRRGSSLGSSDDSTNNKAFNAVDGKLM